MTARHLRAVPTPVSDLDRLRSRRDALARQQALRRQLTDEKHAALEDNYQRHQREIDNLTAQIERASPQE
jgi:hypothetical protein